ncbi:MAG: hypothetical protein HY719_11560 [Planctomycetes bacterium]|nr:hypothetical protein [Planctomycetota bacterium]
MKHRAAGLRAAGLLHRAAKGAARPPIALLAALVCGAAAGCASVSGAELENDAITLLKCKNDMDRDCEYAYLGIASFRETGSAVYPYEALVNAQLLYNAQAHPLQVRFQYHARTTRWIYHQSFLDEEDQVRVRHGPPRTPAAPGRAAGAPPGSGATAAAAAPLTAAEIDERLGRLRAARDSLQDQADRIERKGPLDEQPVDERLRHQRIVARIRALTDDEIALLERMPVSMPK